MYSTPGLAKETYDMPALSGYVPPGSYSAVGSPQAQERSFAVVRGGRATDARPFDPLIGGPMRGAYPPRVDGADRHSLPPGADDYFSSSGPNSSSVVHSRSRAHSQSAVIEGLDSDSVDLDDLASELKSALAVGGTVDEGRIELQGDHADRAPDLLVKRGFEVE